MTPNNNLSVLPFYLDISRQNHRKDYAFGEVFPLFTPDRKILPFQIIREHRTNAISSVILKKLDGSTVTNITTQMTGTGLKVNQYTSYGYDVIVYPGQLLLTTQTPEGPYYIEVSDEVQTWYSEVFTVVRFVDQYLKITYWDSESLVFDGGRVDFSDNFAFNLYLPTQVGRPDYEFEEQVEKRDGYQFVEKQISEKTYKFNFVAPEYLLDAMRIIRMMDNVEVVSKGETYAVDQFLMAPTWQEGGYLAGVEVEFQCATVIKKIGRGFVPADNGDFNNDFNNYFNNS